MDFKDVKILILEDQELIAENLRRVLLKLGAQKVYVATNAEMADQIVASHQLDLLLVDINLGEKQKTGTDFMLELTKIKPIPHIYITANADEKNIMAASATFPEGFLEKPYTQQSIQASISIALRKIGKNKITVNLNNKKILIDINKILFVESDNNYVNLFLDNGQKCVERISLRQLFEKLTPNFVQIHKSFAVNLDAIDFYSGSEVTIKEHKLPIGRNYKSQFKEKVEGLLR